MSDLNKLVENSLVLALNGVSGLTPEVLAVKGFSTPTMRHLFNNLGAGVSKYLEVGVWLGGTATAAVFANKELESLLIDNISQDFSEQNVLSQLQLNL